MDSDALPLSYAEIDLDAIAHNIRAIADHIGPDVTIQAVVKANAYGHGAVPVAQAALQNGASRLAVVRAGEGIELREAGIEAPILVMGYVLPDEAPILAEYDLIGTVNTIEAAEAINRRSRSLGRTTTIHIKVDTGLGRYGLPPDEVVPFIQQLMNLSALDVEGLYTHFAVADTADPAYTNQQFQTYISVVKALEEQGIDIPFKHAANSAAALAHSDTYLDGVRVGIAMYGLRPSDEVPPLVELRPALRLISHVARVRTLPAGSSISYGRTYTTSKSTPVALIPLGYGDGYHRILSNRGKVLIRGQKAPIVGRVCMDQFVVDVSDIEDVQQDDQVILVGQQGKSRISAEELGALAETINYEITTSLLPRLPRLYIRDGKLIDYPNNPD